MLVARVYLKHPGQAKEAEDQLRAAVQEDRHNAEAFYLLGTLYEAAGTDDRAEMMFRKALAIDPRHHAARAKLGGTATAERPHRGVLGRLFGRS
jgi:Tfp pilus assembly protein PilF